MKRLTFVGDCVSEVGELSVFLKVKFITLEEERSLKAIL